MNTDSVIEIFSDLIDIAPGNMRSDIDRDELYSLAENIKANGLISPITVRPVGERYELVAGQRRLLACRIANIIRIPSIVRELDDTKALDVMAAENLERSDVHPVDEAMFLKRLVDEQGASPVDIARRMNRGVQYVKDRLLVADMPDYLQQYLKSGQIKLGVALLLMQIEPESKRKLWTAMAVDQNASVRTVDYWVYQHVIGLLPDAVQSDSDVPGAPIQEYKPILFRCAVDGKEYPVSETMAITIYKGNESLIRALRVELEREAPPLENSPSPSL